MEKRKLERFEVTFPASVRCDSLSGTSSSRITVTRDISSEGAFLLMDPALPEGSEITVEVSLPVARLAKISDDGDVRVVIAGTVVRRDESGVAVQFGGRYRFVSKQAV